MHMQQVWHPNPVLFLDLHDEKTAVYYSYYNVLCFTEDDVKRHKVGLRSIAQQDRNVQQGRSSRFDSQHLKKSNKLYANNCIDL